MRAVQLPFLSVGCILLVYQVFYSAVAALKRDRSLFSAAAAQYHQARPSRFYVIACTISVRTGRQQSVVPGMCPYRAVLLLVHQLDIYIMGLIVYTYQQTTTVTLSLRDSACALSACYVCFGFLCVFSFLSFLSFSSVSFLFHPCLIFRVHACMIPWIRSWYYFIIWL